MPTKLQRPPVPHAEATRKVAEKLRAMSPEQARQTFIASGILTHDGKLSKAYGGNASATTATAASSGKS